MNLTVCRNCPKYAKFKAGEKCLIDRQPIANRTSCPLGRFGLPAAPPRREPCRSCQPPRCDDCGGLHPTAECQYRGEWWLDSHGSPGCDCA